MLREGQRVVYVGYVDDSLLGREGKVLACTDTSAHVKWTSGSISLHAVDELEPIAPGVTVESALDDSLEVGGIDILAAREVYDAYGPVGVLNDMAEAGRLSSFMEVAEEALALVANRIRHDPSFSQITAQLGDEDGEQLVRLASAVLIRDAFGNPEEQ
jgi:hypothetical protein